MEYRTTVRNHFKALETALMILSLLIGAVIYLKFYSNNYYPTIEWDILYITIPVYLPVLHLHLEYCYYNVGAVFEINSYEKEIRYTSKSGEAETYNFDDLSKIVVFMAPSWHRKSNFQLLPFEQYHYAKIFTKSGKVIIITCLMVQRVEDAMRSIKGVPVELKTRVYASVWFD